MAREGLRVYVILRYCNTLRVQADINCMKDHVDSGGDWKYLLNTAALAFPLRTVEETARILRTYNGANDVEGNNDNDNDSRTVT